MKTLLILGALSEFVPLVKMAKDKGIRTLVIDGNADAPAKALADVSYDADIRDTAAIAEIAKREHADAITTAYSDLLLECMVKIADAAGLPCHITPSALPYYRDKAVMAQTCAALHIGTPRTVLLAKDFRDEELGEMAFPMVMKPLNMYGSRGLVVVHTIGEIRSFFDEAIFPTSGNKILVQEYNPDHEFNLQCWVRRGKIHILGLADREKTLFDPHTIPLSTRNIYPSRLMKDVCAPAFFALTKYIGKTGQKEGPLAMQFFWSEERGLQVGEIAARFLGYEHELMRYACGFSTEELLISGALEDQMENLRSLDDILAAGDAYGKKSAAVLYYHAWNGTIADMSGTLAVLHRPDVQYGQIFYHEGEQIGAPQAKPYAARFDIVTDTREETDTLTDEITRQVSMKDHEGRELLKKGVRGNYR
ncbi:MAG: dehydrogenase [Lachnospiraceae bacterium]|nr:dehydrogenase [Lachnospiraceae bacterium]